MHQADTQPLDQPPPLADPALQHDIRCVLIQCHADRSPGHALRADAGTLELEAFAARLAALLAPRIGGRYVPKQSRQITAQRDEAVWRAWQQTRDHRRVMLQFGISRRLLFNILARKRE